MVDSGNDPEAPVPERADGDAPREVGRRRVLKLATVGIGGAMTAGLAAPLAAYFVHPVGRRTVSASKEPVDVLGLDDLARGGAPIRVKIVARELRDGWTVVRDVPLGSAWLTRDQQDKVTAFSATCPHLGCSIQLVAGEYNCPCHKSSFSLDGNRKSGPSKRGLDPLPVQVTKGRVLVTWVQFKPDVSARERS